MDTSTWLIYLVAVIGLAFTPGPNSLLVLTHGALHGHRRARWTVAGGALGFSALMGLSMLGIGALLSASAQALTWMKIAGGAYLVWLGIQVWRSPPIQLEAAGTPAGAASASRLFNQGLLAATTNPKVLLFYGAFLPQFIDPARGLFGQFVVMAATFAVVECAVELGLARLAHRVRPWLQRVGRRFNRACGGLFIAMGAALPLTR